MKNWLSFPGLRRLSKPEILRVYAYATAIWGPIYAPILWSLGLHWIAIWCLLAPIPVALIARYQRRTTSTAFTGNLLVALLYLSITLVWYSFEGKLLYSHWILAIPIVATMLGTPRSGLVWTAVCLAHIVVVEPSGILRLPDTVKLAAGRQRALEVAGTVGVLIFLQSIITLYERFRYRVLERIETKNQELQEALTEVQWLQQILPICMHCRRVRDENADWRRLEEYLDSRSHLQFSHGLCEDCAREHYARRSEPPADEQA